MILFHISRYSKLNCKTQLASSKIVFRCFSSSPKQNNLSNPFNQNKDKAKKDIEEFLKEKSKTNKTIDFQQVLEKSNKTNILGKIAKFILNPQPLNTRFRKEFNIGDEYKLVYLIDTERVHLITNSLINILAPLMILLFGSLIVTEYTGLSKFNELYEETYFYLAFLSCWVLIVFYLAKSTQKSTIMRIYYNSETNKFVSIRMGNLFRFQKEEFTPDKVIYRFNYSLKDKKMNLLDTFTKRHGNVYINNQLKLIDFKLFSSLGVLEKMVGTKSYSYLKTNGEI